MFEKYGNINKMPEEKQEKTIKKLHKKATKLAVKLSSVKSKNSEKSENVSEISKTPKKTAKKSVKFNLTENVILEPTYLERKWNDSKNNKSSFVQGKFQVTEIKLLMQALCQYAKENGLSID